MQNYLPFLDSFFAEIAKVRLDVSGLALDHLAYQASSSSEYETIKPTFRELGKLVHETQVNGRRVAIFKLHEPWEYQHYRISALELIEPKAGQTIESGFQHAEFVATEPFENIMAKYPQLPWDTSSMNRSEFSHLKLNFENGLTLKFLEKPILELVTAWE